MANPHMRPVSDDLAPDTARVYERADPKKEAGMGRLDNNDDAVPAESPDCIEHAVTHRQAIRQINAEDMADAKEEGQAKGWRVRSEEPRPDGSDVPNE